METVKASGQDKIFNFRNKGQGGYQIDLHGMQADYALNALKQFVTKAQRAQVCLISYHMNAVAILLYHCVHSLCGDCGPRDRL
jgi:hypothetical protein